MRAIWKIAFFQNAIFLKFFLRKNWASLLARSQARSLASSLSRRAPARRQDRSPSGGQERSDRRRRRRPPRAGRWRPLGRHIWWRAGRAAGPCWRKVYTHISIYTYVTAGSRHLLCDGREPSLIYTKLLKIFDFQKVLHNKWTWFWKKICDFFIRIQASLVFIAILNDL